MLVLDVQLDGKVPVTSSVPYQEDVAESFDFETPHDGLYVVSVAIPISVHSMVDGKYNAACRVYLDGDDWLRIDEARQWNGFLLSNGGQWCCFPRMPIDGSCTRTLCIPIAKGKHTIRACVSCSSEHAVLTLRSRRIYQVWE